MKSSDYVLLFGMLMVCISSLCVYGVGSAEPNAANLKHNAQGILKSRAENKPIREDPNEIARQTLMRKTHELQYTQLLEVHRSYFMAFLQVLAIYLAVMGACLKFVCDSIENMEDPHKNGSRTVLFALITFAVITSTLFLLGLQFGEEDAIERNGHIALVAKLLYIAKPVNTELITNLFAVMAIGAALIVVGWYAIFIRGLKAARKKHRWPLIVGTVILLIYWLVVLLDCWQISYLMILKNLYFVIVIAIVTALTIMCWLVALIGDQQKSLGTICRSLWEQCYAAIRQN